MINDNVPKPEVGMGATMRVGSDSYPYTIVRVSESGKTFWMQEDKATPTAKHEGPYGQQDYSYSPNPVAPIRAVRATKRGWRHLGTPVSVGVRRMYRDPSY